MERRGLLFAIIGVVVVGLVLLVGLLPRVQERLAPTPKQAWLGIEVGGSGIAEVGRVRMAAGTPFRLHAVLEAERRDGSSVYYTEAPALRLGDRQVESEAVRRYDLGGIPKLLWFTIEGSVPYLALEPGQGLDRFRPQAFFRPEWGRSWSVAGSLDSLNDSQLEDGSSGEDRTFGSQHYEVWIEVFASKSALLPEARYKSPGVEALRASPERFAAVVSQLPGAAGPASRVFGLTQIEPPPEAPAELRSELAALAASELVFTRLTVIRDQIAASGRSLDSLSWRRVDLESATSWQTVGAGDLLRVGGRLVVLYRDAGREGVLDPEDLCFDFDQGAAVRPLNAVFVGHGEVEWASLEPLRGVG